ncbi:MAG: phosphate/phosphite/phosphonate ABC transporter substrate-binding protein [Anaerolineae bacterium]|nr:phosphate/phosphite/phosphonate ABC transporter substrate-binding protein [Anaerolineae bacterium]
MKKLLGRYKYAVLLAALTLGMILAAPSREKPTLVFAVIPAEDAGRAHAQFTPMVEHLSQEIGIEVELLTVADYAAAVEALKYGHADFARFGPFTYVMAVEEAGAEIIATAVKASSGAASYTSMIITRADRDITSLEGASFAYVDVGSTSGYLAPHTYIVEAGIRLGEVFFAGSHNAVIEAVKNGTVDAGAVASNRYYVALDEGVLAEGEVVVVWESDPIPNAPIAVRQGMDPALKAKILSAFLSAPQEVVEAMGIGETGYVSAADSDYDVIRRMQAIQE